MNKYSFSRVEYARLIVGFGVKKKKQKQSYKLYKYFYRTKLGKNNTAIRVHLRGLYK